MVHTKCRVFNWRIYILQSSADKDLRLKMYTYSRALNKDNKMALNITSKYNPDS